MKKRRRSDAEFLGQEDVEIGGQDSDNGHMMYGCSHIPTHALAYTRILMISQVRSLPCSEQNHSCKIHHWSAQIVMNNHVRGHTSRPTEDLVVTSNGVTACNLTG